MLRIIEHPQEIYQLCRQWQNENKRVGLVPTMGALHEGHLALCQKARQQNDKVIVSIFVNPTQFGQGEDYDKYLRPFEKDCQLLEELGCDAVFSPSVDLMYPQPPAQIYVDVLALANRWEGAIRPGHFRGVVTVVSKLFNIVPAQRAYFGEKDYQQLKIIQHLVRDLNFPVEIIPVATVRENDGLAKSSRNAYLNESERAAAKVLFAALNEIKNRAANGEKNSAELLNAAKNICQKESLFKLDYIALVDESTLEELTEINAPQTRALISGYVGKTHLIDNLKINFN